MSSQEKVTFKMVGNFMKFYLPFPPFPTSYLAWHNLGEAVA